MSTAKGGPKWRVTRKFPQAHSLPQRNGSYKIVNGIYEPPGKDQCIGEGSSLVAAWRDAARRLK